MADKKDRLEEEFFRSRALTNNPKEDFYEEETDEDSE